MNKSCFHLDCDSMSFVHMTVFYDLRSVPKVASKRYAVTQVEHIIYKDGKATHAQSKSFFF